MKRTGSASATERDPKRPLLERLIAAVEMLHREPLTIHATSDAEYLETMKERLHEFVEAANAENPPSFWKEAYPAKYEHDPKWIWVKREKEEDMELEEGEVRY